MQTHIWAEIRRLSHLEKKSISEIARIMNMDRKTVRRALGSDTAPIGQITVSRPSKLDKYKAYIQEKLKEYPNMPATVLYDEILKLGYDGKIRIVWDYVSGIRVRNKEAFLRYPSSFVCFVSVLVPNSF